MKNCGIYQIKNLQTGDFYIGQSNNTGFRWANHRSQLRRGKHENRHLQNAWNKYGEDCFGFSVLLFCEEDELTYYEQSLVDKRKPAYNLLKLCTDSTRRATFSYAKDPAVVRTDNKRRCSVCGKPCGFSICSNCTKAWCADISGETVYPAWVKALMEIENHNYYVSRYANDVPYDEAMKGK